MGDKREVLVWWGLAHGIHELVGEGDGGQNEK